MRQETANRLLRLIESSPSPPARSAVRGHARAEARSLARHRAIAVKLVEHPDWLQERVLPTIARFKKIHAGSKVVRDLEEWEAAAQRGIEPVIRICLDIGEDGKRLRQNTPLVSILDESERLQIHEAFAP